MRQESYLLQFEKLDLNRIVTVCQQVGLLGIRNRKNKTDKIKLTQKMFEDQIKIGKI